MQIMQVAIYMGLNGTVLRLSQDIRINRKDVSEKFEGHEEKYSMLKDIQYMMYSCMPMVTFLHLPIH